MKSLFRYEQKDSLLHRLDPRVKLLWLFGVSVLSVVLGTPYLLVLLFISTLPFWFILKPPISRIKAILLVSGSIMLSFTFSQALFLLLGKRAAVYHNFSILPGTGASYRRSLLLCRWGSLRDVSVFPFYDRT